MAALDDSPPPGKEPAITDETDDPPPRRHVSIVGVGWNEIEFTALNEDFSIAANALRSRSVLCRHYGPNRM
jgi:hypothetical protein